MPILLPQPKFHATDDDGNPLVGGKLYAYVAGTSTPKDTYTDYGLGTANTNPVILDARGECDLWGDGNYKLTLTDANDVQIWSVDNIRDLTNSATFLNATLSGTTTITGSQVAWPGNPIHTGNHQFANNVTVSGNTILGDAAGNTLTINPNAISYPNNPTHADNHAFSGNVSFNGNTTLGNAGSDTITVTGATTITGDVTISTTGGELRHGPNYTPTLGTISANVASSTANPHRWFRVGDCVTVQGSISVTPTAAAATTTQLGISLPISTNFAALTDVQAPALSHGNLGNTTGYITASAANDIVFLTFAAGSTGADTWSYTFVYEVKA